VGDFDPVQARQMVEKYFGGIKQSQLPAVPDLAEAKQEKEKQAKKVDALAQRPAIAIAYHMPERNTPEYYAMGLIDQILIEGDDSLEYQQLVQKKGLTAEVEGGINYLGNMFNYQGPMLFMADFKTDPGTSPDTAVKAWDDPIEALRAKPVSKETLDRARVKLRSNLYDSMGQIGGFGLADLLASFALFDDNPARINTLASEFEKVTPQLIQKTAQEYLRPENRTVLVLQTKSAEAPAAPAKN
jgi:predicted Zn-dependent peptidase